jgi:hypothetical protein
VPCHGNDVIHTSFSSNLRKPTSRSGPQTNQNGIKYTPRSDRIYRSEVGRTLWNLLSFFSFPKLLFCAARPRGVTYIIISPVAYFSARKKKNQRKVLIIKMDCGVSLSLSLFFSLAHFPPYVIINKCNVFLERPTTLLNDDPLWCASTALYFRRINHIRQ